MNDEEIGAQLALMLRQRTDAVTGRATSLEDLLAAAPKRRLRHPTKVWVPAAAVACLVGLIVGGAFALKPGGGAPLSQSSGSTADVALGTGTATTFPPAQYFLALNREGATVIVRTADDRVERTLPISLMSARLSTDGTRVYGAYYGSLPPAGDGGASSQDRSIVANSCPNKRVNPAPCWVPAATQRLVARDADYHLGYLDLATDRFTTIQAVSWGPNADNTVLTSTSSPDGSVAAWVTQPWGNIGTVTLHILDVGSGERTDIVVPDQHQVPWMTAAPDGSQLVMRVNNTPEGLFTVRTRDSRMQLTALTDPPSTCPGDDTYDYPVWTGQGVFAQYNCSNDGRTKLAQIVQVDPADGHQIATVANLPTGGLTFLKVAEGPSGPRLLFAPAVGTEVAINSLYLVEGAHGPYIRQPALHPDR